jgi:polar amino acid transport system permease protein
LKRTTKTKLTRGVLYAVLCLLLLVAVLSADWAAIKENFLDTEVMAQLWPGIVTIGAKNTIVYTFTAFAGGLAVALVLALMKLSPVAPYRWIATTYIEFFRGLPALLVIILFALAVPLAFGWTPPGGLIGAGVLALIIVAAAYMAETLRAGIQAVPKGQVEAAKSLGMSGTWTMASIVLPQALRIVIPPLTNEFVLLLKDSSLLAIIGATAAERELTTLSRDSLTEFSNGTPLIAAAVMYLIITLPLTGLVARLERRTQRAR